MAHVHQPQLQHQHQPKVVYTPFLPSNSIPGAFRPIIPNEQYETSQPNSVNINTVSNNNNNNHQYQIEVAEEQEKSVPVPQPQPQQHIEVIPSTPKPFYLSTQYEQIHPSSQQQQQQQPKQKLQPQPQQPKYVTYLRPQPQYLPVVKTTPRPTISIGDANGNAAASGNGDREQHYVYRVEHVLPPVSATSTTTRKPTIKVYKNSYKIQTHSEQPQIKAETGRLAAGNEHLDATLFANVKYVTAMLCYWFNDFLILCFCSFI